MKCADSTVYFKVKNWKYLLSIVDAYKIQVKYKDYIDRTAEIHPWISFDNDAEIGSLEWAVSSTEVKNRDIIQTYNIWYVLDDQLPMPVLEEVFLVNVFNNDDFIGTVIWNGQKNKLE